MVYVMTVTDLDGHKHRIECASHTDLMNWIFKFAADLADSEETGKDHIIIDIRKVTHNERYTKEDTAHEG